MMISINGVIEPSNHFDWLSDSGYQYGYGWFETMRFHNGTIPLLDAHQDRLTHSLSCLHIDYEPDGLYDRIISLANALDLTHDATCKVYVSGGNVTPTPQFKSSPTEIITFSSMPPHDFLTQCAFKPIIPSDIFQHKSMAYAHHIQALKTSSQWPIYVDKNRFIIDSAIFSVGMIHGTAITFASHDQQLPSVSRQTIMNQCPNTTHAPIHQDDWNSADAHLGCNALRGAFPISMTTPHPPMHPVIDEINTALGFNARDLG